MDEEEIAGSLKKIRIRIRDEGEFRFDEKRAREIAHELYIEQEEQR